MRYRIMRLSGEVIEVALFVGVILCLLLCSGWFTGSVSAQAVDFPAFTVEGSEFQIASSSLDERKPRVAYNSVDNEYLVVYDKVNTSTNIDIRARRFDAAGNQLGSEIMIASSGGKDVQPDVAYSPVDNQYLVVYQRENATYDIYGRVVTASGQIPNSGFLIANTKAGSTSVHDKNPDIEYNSATNRFLIAFESDLTGRGLNRKVDVVGILVDSDGTALSSAYTIGGLEHDDEIPSVAYNSTDDEFMVAFHANTNNDGDYDVYATRIDGNGTTILNQSILLQDSSTSEKFPNIAYDSVNNEYMVSSEYDVYGNGSSFDVFYQKLDQYGAEIDTLLANNPSSQVGSNKIITRAAYIPYADSFFTVYETTSPDTVEGMGLQMDGTTTQRGPELTIGNGGLSGDWHRPDLVYNSTENEFFVVWSEVVSANGSLNIFGRLVRPVFSCEYVTDVPKAECEALVDLYDSTNGDSWSTNTGWEEAITGYNGDTTVCDWHGVTCASGSVSRLQLTYNNLAGSIPTSIEDLTNLEWLRLYANSLTGSLPAELSELSELIILDLRYNDLTGTIPSDLGDLSNLQYLRFHDNDLTGSIPPQLGNLDNLIDLSLGMNNLTGTIPPQLGDMSNLVILALYRNGLSGSIPADLGDLSNLRYLGLYENDLSGEIPSAIGQLSNLETLSLSANDLEGDIPSSLWNMTSLVSIGLKRNQLTGTIPSDLTSLVNLDSFVVSYNSELEGTITSSTFHHTLTTLDVSNTQIVVQ